MSDAKSSPSTSTKGAEKKKSARPRKVKSEEKDDKAPKKRTPYMEFQALHAPKLRAEGLSFAEVSRKISEMWATDPSNPNAGKPKKSKKAKSDEEPAEETSKKLEEPIKTKILETDATDAKACEVEQ